MRPAFLFSGNWLAWLAQAALLASFGAALPLLFRIRHPRTQLAYCHALLVVCVLLPLLEPWQHALWIRSAVTAAATVPKTVQKTFPKNSWDAGVMWIIAAGMVARLGWLAAGLWQIRRFRAAALPLFPIPDSIRQARALTGADARFAISTSIDGPAALGHVDPMILLPGAFLAMEPETQLSIACHELLHVRRHDWLVTLFEEIAGALLWFNPAIWWLLSQTKLCREQLIDGEVVALTAAPASYVQALLAIAVPVSGLTTIPAPSFLSGGHLRRRVHAVLVRSRVSRGRLLLSYASIAVLLGAIGWSAMLWFPLIGEARPVDMAAWTPLAAPALRLADSVPAAVEPAHAILFTQRLPAPQAPRGNVIYRIASAELPVPENGTMPGGSPPQFLLRLIRPGDRVTPEDLERMQAALGERTILELTQTEDGTVQRITILRRPPDEIHTVPFDLHIGADGTGGEHGQ